MRAKDAVGQYGERVAARFLEATGLRVVDRNWRCRSGELDIVAEDDGVLVFVEVKTRRGLDFGEPAAAVTQEKRERIRRVALQWLAEHRQPWRELRFDVISVVPGERGPATVEHLRGAF